MTTDLDADYVPPVLRCEVAWHPVAQQFSLHVILTRSGAKQPNDLVHVDYYVGRMAPERALARALAKECDDLRAIREGERAELPF